ncbi:MAG: hypothetical protein LBG60_11165 [Bifidobacteriaceae bacterium]|jgi:predicted nucleic acid-binding protein|nr:hypothetical protein [Bifidobacteriaceae bacterium]
MTNLPLSIPADLLAPARLRAAYAQEVAAAIETSIRHQVNYWDALIVEAAASAGCARLLTEDLDDGQIISGVRVTNPFRGP